MPLTPSNLRLVKIASIGGLFVSVTGYYMKYLVDEKLRKSDYYLKAAAHVLAHRPLVEFLGEPIKFRNADLSDISRNYTVGETEAVFEIPLSGSQKSGIMHFKALRTPDDTLDAKAPKEPPKLSWKVVKLEVSIDGRPGERVLVPIKPLNACIKSIPQPQSPSPVTNQIESSKTNVQNKI